MTTIALTGGIASGKTTIANRLRELGAVVLDADQFARAAVEPGTPALRAIRDRFGEHVLCDDGTLDRARLGAIVFADDDEREALNAIVHPEIRRLTDDAKRAARADDPDAIVVHDIPLLLESRHNYDYDEIWVADAPAEVRLERLLEDRGLDRVEGQRRIDAQVSDDERRRVADVLFDTTAPLGDTLDQVDREWARVSGGQAAAGDHEYYDSVRKGLPEEERNSEE